MNTILQVPLSKDLREKASAAATAQGFSSLQESVRVFLTQMVRGEIVNRFDRSSTLSTEAEKRYLGMLSELENDKTRSKKFESAGEVLNYLDKAE